MHTIDSLIFQPVSSEITNSLALASVLVQLTPIQLLFREFTNADLASW